MNAVHARLRVPALPSLAAAAATALTLAGCGGSSAPARPNVTLTHTASTNRVVDPGQQASYDITVTNSGRAASTDIRFEGYHGPLSQVVDVECKASGGAACPASMSLTPTVESLPAGGSLTFEFTFAIDPTATGHVYDTVYVRSNYAAANVDVMETLTVHDAIAGDYPFYAADGAELDATVDFVAATLAVEGGAVDRRFEFQRELLVPAYNVFSADKQRFVARFRTPTDMLVGTLDVGNGVQPFVAPRKFVDTLADLDGHSFTIVSRDAVAGGAATTQAWAARFEGATLVACRKAAPLSVDNCPANAQTRYTLAIGPTGLFSRIDPDTAEVVMFRVARSGDTLVMVSADAPAGHQRFEIGLEPKAVLDEHSYDGGDTLGQQGFVTLMPGSYAVIWGVLESHDAARLVQVPGGPAGLFSGPRLSDGAPMFVLAQGPLALALGVPGGGADGEMQVWSAVD